MKQCNSVNEEIPCEVADPNLSEIAGVEALVRVYRCWNCEEEGHGCDMCMKERKVFCYGCGEKNIYKP